MTKHNKKNAESPSLPEEKFRALLSASSEGLLIHLDGIILEVNQTLCEMFGYTEDELIGRSLLNFMTESAQTPASQHIQKGYQNPYERDCVKKNGELLICETKAKACTYKGQIARAVSVKDVSQRKQIELALQNSRENYKNLVEQSPDGIFIFSPNEGKIIFANPSAFKIIEISSLEELKNKTVLDFLLPEYHAAVKERMQANYPPETRVFQEMKLKTANGNSVELELQAEHVQYDGKKAIQVTLHKIGIEKQLAKEKLRSQLAEEANIKLQKEIDERKKAEQKLRDSEEQYRAFYEQAFIGIAQVSLKGVFIRVNEQFCNIVGYSKEEISNKTFMEITVPEDLEKSIDYRIKLIRGDMNKASFEKKYIHKSGQIININVILSLQRDGDGNPMHFIAMFQDITKRIKTEQEKLAQSAKLTSIFESSSHIIWTVDSKFCLTSFNKNFVNQMNRWFEFKPSIGSSFIRNQGISSMEYDTFWKDKYRKVLNGTLQYFEISQIDKENDLVWHEIYLNPIINAEGKIIEVSGIAHDITEKKLSEEKIHQSLQEKEILLKEVHHRVKNNLQVISSILNLQSSYVKDEVTLNILNESQNRIKSMAFIHESLYQTKDFTSINFTDYVKKLSQNLMHSYSNLDQEINLNLDIQNIFLNLDLAIPCGLIINEIISNSLKYAFCDTCEDGEITIEMRSEGDNLVLFVGDNGVGLPQHINFRNTESLGLQLVVTLTDQLMGTIELDKKKGTNFIIIFNKNQVKNRI